LPNIGSDVKPEDHNRHILARVAFASIKVSAAKGLGGMASSAAASRITAHHCRRIISYDGISNSRPPRAAARM
jgi:hypothetical protein